MKFRSFLSVTLAVLLGLEIPALAQAPQAGPPPAKLNIVILEGEGATNNIRQRVAREPIVQVEDENRRPLAGAAVVFTLPNSGASGVFPNGSRVLTVMTDQNGRAVARGLQPNSVTGDMQIRVNASFRGVTASVSIAQTNAAGAAAAGAGAGSGKLIGILAVVGGAAAAGIAVAATRGNGNGPPGAPPVSPTVITPGSPTVGPPN